VVLYAGLTSRSYRLRNKSSLQLGARRFIAMPFIIAAVMLDMAISPPANARAGNRLGDLQAIAGIRIHYLPNPEVQNPACIYKSE
jgi:hypothetical protein